MNYFGQEISSIVRRLPFRTFKTSMTIKKIAKTTWPRPSLCCSPNIKVKVRNLSLITSTAPIVLQINYFRENIWVSAVSLSLHICRTSWQDTQNYTSNHAFFLLFPCRPPKFCGWVKQVFRNSLRRYLSSWRLKANIWIFQIAFSQWIAPLTRNRFLVFV